MTTRELSRAIAAFIPSATLPLPDDLTQVVDAYLKKHHDYDQSASDRLNDELLSIHQKFIIDHPARYAPFLSILRRLRPAIRATDHVLQWWDKLTEPVLDCLGQEKGLMSEALANFEGITMYDGSDDSDQGDQEVIVDLLASRLVKKWMTDSRIQGPERGSNSYLKEKVMRNALFFFGKKQPKSFFVALDSFLVVKEHRNRSIALLSEFIQSQPPHLHLVLETPLFDNIIRSLQNDTATTTVSLALTSLIMLLPHMPSSIVPFLPTLFNIYARLLFWDRQRSAAPEDVGAGAAWEKCAYSPGTDGTCIPHLPGYFTILYGLYPINFTDYIRKPQRYLRHANVESADDSEAQPSEIRHRSERYQQWHLLHPNFYTLTIDSEKTDRRWLKSEPADVVAECVALCLPTEIGHFDAGRAEGAVLTPEDVDKDGSDHALLSGSGMGHPFAAHDARRARSDTIGSPSSSRAQSALMRHSSQSSHPSARDSVEARTRDVVPDSPTLPPHLVVSTSQAELQNMINSNKAIKSGLHQSLANDSVPSLALSHQDSIPEKPSARAPGLQPSISTPSPAPDGGEQVAELKRQNILLKNDLNFERYMTQQHMAHIGALKRGQVKEAAAEAEAQNLIMTNRNLKHRLEEARRAEMQAKKESEKSRSLSKKWEADLSGKLRNLREEQKKWNSEGAALRRDMSASREECERLRKLVCEAEVRELNSKQTMQSIEIDSGEMARLKGDVTRLTAAGRESQRRERERELAMEEATEAESRAERLRMKLQAREAELRQTKEYYQSQVATLNVKLAGAQKERRRRSGGTAAKQMMDGALAASRAKHLELQKQHSLLMRKYTVLQSSLLDMSCATPSKGKNASVAWADADSDAQISAIVGSPVGSRTQKTVPEQEAFEAGSYNNTPPLGSLGSAGSEMHRPSTPSGQPGAVVSSTSPQSERYYGRGGVQNTVRKDKKDKKKEEPDKKDKKSTGIRGIRGFV